MDIAHPGTALTSEVTARALEVLAGTTKPLSGSDIHRLSGNRSRQSTVNALDRLADHGLVITDRRPAATYYTANREHLIWPIVNELVSIRRRILERIGQELAAWVIAPIHASLFGSAARGDGDTKSDVDLLLLRPDDISADDEEVWERQLDQLRRKVVEMTGNHAQTFVMTTQRLRSYIQADDPIVKQWLRDSVLLRGRPLSAITSDLIGVG